MAYSPRYNSYLYRAKVRSLLRAIRDHRVQVRDSEVLDVGSGTGFWIRWWLQAGAFHVTGLDISQRAVDKLTQEFPQAEFHATDICSPFPFEKEVYIINAFDVMYHIISEKQFMQALSQMAEHLLPGGYMFVTDLFAKEDHATAKHVCFHRLQSYEQVFSQTGCRILSINPLYGLLNGMLFDWLGKINPKLRSGVRKIEELTVPLLYGIDGFWIPRQGSNLKLMIVQRMVRRKT